MLMQLVFYTSGIGSLSKLGGHLINVMTTDKSQSGAVNSTGEAAGKGVKRSRQALGV